MNLHLQRFHFNKIIVNNTADHNINVLTTTKKNENTQPHLRLTTFISFILFVLILKTLRFKVILRLCKYLDIIISLN